MLKYQITRNNINDVFHIKKYVEFKKKYLLI